MENWYELLTLIKDIANNSGYMIEIANAMTKIKCLDEDKIYEYKAQMLSIHYELNYKLLLYIGLLRKLDVSYTRDDTVYLDYYKTVVNMAEKIKKTVLDFLDSRGKAEVHIDQNCNSELLNRVIRETEKKAKESELTQDR